MEIVSVDVFMIIVWLSSCHKIVFEGRISYNVCNSIGVNLSERKSGTERTKKRKKLELVFFFSLLHDL